MPRRALLAILMTPLLIPAAGAGLVLLGVSRTRADADATTYRAAQVGPGPKEGYNTIVWDPSATLVGNSELELDNTVLCKVSMVAR